MAFLLVGGALAASASAANLAVSIGVRETGTAAAIGADGGTAGGIEWINLDGLSLPIDGQWHDFSFHFGTDPVAAFAGATANGVLDGTRGTLEHLRIRNIDGYTSPLQVWIDNIVNTQATGLPTQLTGFEGFAPGTQVMFREPDFSGSTDTNIMAGSAAGVVTDAFTEGAQSYRFDMQFVDNDPARWVRLTTNSAANLVNPTIDFGPGSTLSFSLRAIPEPATLGLVGLTAGMGLRRRR